MFTWIAAQASRFRQARSGAVAIQVGLLAVVLIGMSALGVEIGFAYSKQRQMQSVVDAASTGAAASLSDSVSDPTGEARSIAGHLGFVNGVAGVVVTVNHPPLNGVHVGDTNSVEVIVKQPQTLSMATNEGVRPRGYQSPHLRHDTDRTG
jgi:Flp pilus assembly protein TadG